MKKFFITLIVSLCAMQSIVAQDVLITTQGDVMTVFIEDISSSTIYYKTENSDAAQLQRIDKSKVYMIKKADGTKIDLSSASTPTQKSTTPNTAQPLSNETSEEAKQRNKELIASINSLTPEYVGKLGKDASRVFCVLGITENSCMVNDEVELSMKIIKANPTYGISTIEAWKILDFANPMLVLTVKNRTANTIYIDLGNTFFVRGENAVAYYIPSATSTASTSSSGVSVNAGAVTGALGIGGAVGQLANGVNVGGGSSSTTVNITYSQRVIAVPPMSSKPLDGQLLFNTTGYFFDGLNNRFYDKGINYPEFYFKKQKGDPIFEYGHVHTYSESASPVHFSIVLTYSNTEDCAQTKSIASSLFAKCIVGMGTSKQDISNFKDFSLYFIGIAWNARSASGTVFPRP